MIEFPSVEKPTKPIEPQNEQVAGKEPPSNPYPDTLDSAKKEETCLNRLYQFFNRIFEWILSNICCCFASDKERQDLLDEIEKFAEVYFQLFDEAADPSPEVKKTKVKSFYTQFKKLDPKLQKKVKYEIQKQLKEIFAGKTQDYYEKKTNKILKKEPFSPIIDSKNPPPNDRCDVVSIAILTVSDYYNEINMDYQGD